MSPLRIRGPREPNRRSFGSLILLSIVFVSFFCVACSNDPVERNLARMESLVSLLETHKESPDALLEALEAFVDEHEADWAKDRAAFDAMDEDARRRLQATHGGAMQEATRHLMVVTGEVQDRLKTEPKKLLKFLGLMKRLGAS